MNISNRVPVKQPLGAQKQIASCTCFIPPACVWGSSFWLSGYLGSSRSFYLYTESILARRIIRCIRVLGIFVTEMDFGREICWIVQERDRKARSK